MTLVEFMLARIAEDEAAAERIETTSCEGVESAAEMDYFRFAERARSDCEAKRRIVERCRPRYAIIYRESERLLAEAFDQATMHTEAHSGPIWPFDGAEAILRDLASVYADHPDYDEARP